MKTLLLLVTYLLGSAAFIAVVYVATASYALSFTSSGRSMEPTLRTNDLVIVNVFDHTPEVGDIITFDCTDCGNDNKFAGLIKRVTKIRDDCLWIEGDNKELSLDSREYGWVCSDQYSMLEIIYPITWFNERFNR